MSPGCCALHPHAPSKTSPSRPPPPFSPPPKEDPLLSTALACCCCRHPRAGRHPTCGELDHVRCNGALLQPVPAGRGPGHVHMALPQVRAAVLFGVGGGEVCVYASRFLVAVTVTQRFVCVRAPCGVCACACARWASLHGYCPGHPHPAVRVCPCVVWEFQVQALCGLA